MTIPVEEKWALQKTRDFLRQILHKNLTEIKKDARKIRKEAGSCLRHFPPDYRIEDIWDPIIDEYNAQF